MHLLLLPVCVRGSAVGWGTALQVGRSCVRFRHLRLDKAMCGNDAPNWPETCFHRGNPSPLFPLLVSTTTEGDIVYLSPPGLVQHARTVTPIASRLYEAVEVEGIPTTNTTSTTRRLPGRDVDGTATISAPRYQPTAKVERAVVTTTHAH